MSRLEIAARIYAVLIRRSPRDFTTPIEGASQRAAIEALATAALDLADVLITADARSLSQGEKASAIALPGEIAH